jgi:hypothetical protein
MPDPWLFEQCDGKMIKYLFVVPLPKEPRKVQLKSLAASSNEYSENVITEMML